jgi:aryl-alcohol dehydrogenase-like predicted oxidoreductase
MEKRKLGTSDLEITPVGFGAWAIGGGDYAFGWGDQDDAESISTIEHAVCSGINWIDTAAVYGLGRSEEVVGRALKNIGSANRPYVFTKCSLVWNEVRDISHSLEPTSIRHEVEGSLKRLAIDTIDLYQIHWPRLTPEDSDQGIEAGWQTLVELKREGKVRNIGVSNFDAAQLSRISEIEKPASLQPPYSALRRDIETEVLPYCEANHIGTIVYSPMQAGLLSGKMTRERVAAFPSNDWRTRNPYFAEPALTKNLAIAEKFKEIGERRGLTGGAAAIAWTLRLSSVTGAIVGARRPDQIDGIIGAGDLRLSTDEIGEIQNVLTSDRVSDTAA